MWRSLNHECILPFLGIFEDESASLMFLVSPYMKNGTLSQWRKKTRPSTLEIQRLVRISLDCPSVHIQSSIFIDFRSSRRHPIYPLGRHSSWRPLRRMSTSTHLVRS